MIMINIIDAAKYLVFLSYKNMKSLTPLKLQKILYLSQGWSYVWDDKPLFREYFSAWQYGPVNVEVYEYFKKYGRTEIPEDEALSYIDDSCSRETLEAVWKNYCNYSAFELVNLTHQQLPWIKAFKRGTAISNLDIRDYFQSTY